MTIKEKLCNITSEDNIAENVPMSEHTSFRAGGRARIFVTPTDISELKAVLRTLDEDDYPYMIVGNGSNILVRDGGYDGVIVKIGEAFDYIEVSGDEVRCGAATALAAVSRTAAAANLSGFEFASGIPGSIGGAVFMNAGAYGGEMSHVLKEARIVSRNGANEYSANASDMAMGYRHTCLHESGDIVTEATIKLLKGDREKIQSKIAELTSKRNAKQPISYPSAGSFFKRPEGHFVGTMIEEAGLKGLSVGGAQVSELHAGFIVNKGGASASDILQLMEIVRARVMDKFGVELKPEVRIIGNEL